MFIFNRNKFLILMIILILIANLLPFQVHATSTTQVFVNIPGGKVLLVPYLDQGVTQWCWANSIAMILQYYGKKVHAWDLANVSACNKGWNEGVSRWESCIKNTIKNMWKLNLKVELFFPFSLEKLTKNKLWDKIVSKINNNIPVSLWIKKFWSVGGHVVVIIGYMKENNKRYLIIHDPSGALLDMLNIASVHDIFGRKVNSIPYAYILIDLEKLNVTIAGLSWIEGGSPNPPKAVLNIVNFYANPHFLLYNGKISNLRLNNIMIWYPTAVNYKNNNIIILLCITNTFFETLYDINLNDVFNIKIYINNTLYKKYSKEIPRVNNFIFQSEMLLRKRGVYNIKIELYNKDYSVKYDELYFKIKVYDDIIYREYDTKYGKTYVTYALMNKKGKLIFDTFVNTFDYFSRYISMDVFIKNKKVCTTNYVSTDTDNDLFYGDPNDKGLGGDYPKLHCEIKEIKSMPNLIKVKIKINDLSLIEDYLYPHMGNKIYIVKVDAIGIPVNLFNMKITGRVEIFSAIEYPIKVRLNAEYKAFLYNVILFNKIITIKHGVNVFYFDGVINKIFPFGKLYIKVFKDPMLIDHHELYITMIKPSDIKISKVNGLVNSYTQFAKVNLEAILYEKIAQILPDELITFKVKFNNTEITLTSEKIRVTRINNNGYNVTYKLLGRVPNLKPGRYKINLMVLIKGEIIDDYEVGWTKILGKEIGHANIVMSIDVSGSMGDLFREKTKLDWAKDAAKYLVLKSRDRDFIGIVGFSDEAFVIHDIVKINSNTRLTLIDAIDELVEGGNTNIGDGLLKSLKLLSKDYIKTNGYPRVIILLTNGRHNTGINPIKILPQLKDEGIKVYTIGLGEDVNRDLLIKIAKETGGKYYYAPTPDELDTIFADIYGIAALLTSITKIKDNIKEGEIKSYNLILDPANYYQISLKWTGSTLDLHIIFPDYSIVITPRNATAIGINVRKGANFIIYEFSNAGSYLTRIKLKVIGLKLDSFIENYTITVLSDSVTNVDIFTNKINYKLNEPIIISAIGPINWNAQAIIHYPNGTLATVVDLYDDGLHDDGGKDDGLYSKIIRNITVIPGRYDVDIIFVDSRGVTRWATTSFLVSDEHYQPFIKVSPNYIKETVINSKTITLLVTSSQESIVYSVIDPLISNITIISPDNIILSPSEFTTNSSGTMLNMTILIPPDTPPGIYKGAIMFHNIETITIIPITINVPLSILSVKPPLIKFNYTRGESAEFSFTVSIEGSQINSNEVFVDISGNITDITSGWLDKFTLKTGEIMDLNITVNTNTVGNYTGVVTFYSPHTLNSITVPIIISILKPSQGVSGYVLDSETGKAIVNAIVLLIGADNYYLGRTNSTGYYFIESPAGNYTIIALAMGYETANKTITVVNDKFSIINFNLTYIITKSIYEKLNQEYNKLRQKFNKLNQTYTILRHNYHSLMYEYESLMANYNNLTSTYNNLRKRYNQLSDKYDQLNNKYNETINNLLNELNIAKNIVYILIATITIISFIFIIVLIYLKRKII